VREQLGGREQKPQEYWYPLWVDGGPILGASSEPQDEQAQAVQTVAAHWAQDAMSKSIADQPENR
jgi:hypothetical protein